MSSVVHNFCLRLLLFIAPMPFPYIFHTCGKFSLDFSFHFPLSHLTIFSYTEDFVPIMNFSDSRTCKAEGVSKGVLYYWSCAHNSRISSAAQCESSVYSWGKVLFFQVHALDICIILDCALSLLFSVSLVCASLISRFSPTGVSTIH